MKFFGFLNVYTIVSKLSHLADGFFLYLFIAIFFWFLLFFRTIVARLGISVSFCVGRQIMYSQFQGLGDPNLGIDCQLQGLGNLRPSTPSDSAGQARSDPSTRCLEWVLKPRLLHVGSPALPTGLPGAPSVLTPESHVIFVGLMGQSQHSVDRVISEYLVVVMIQL